MPQTDNAVNEEMLNVQLHSLINLTIIWLLILTAPIGGLAIFRNIKADDHRTTLAVLMIWVFALGLYLIRSKLSRTQTTWILFSSLVTYSCVVLFQIGLISAAPFVLLLSVVLAAIFLPFKAAILGLIIGLAPLIAMISVVSLGYAAPVPVASLGLLAVPHTWVVTTLIATTVGLVIFVIIRRVRTLYLSQSTAYRQTLFEAMGALSTLRDMETGNHLKRCGLYAKALFEVTLKAGSSEAEPIPEQYLQRAIELHDIGKIAISDAILQKPGKLTKQEFEVMKQHTVIGADMINSMLSKAKLGNDSSAIMAQEIALAHHENFDGSGYPYGVEGGMVGKNIPFAARLMAIIDVYDALRSERPYKKPFTHEESLAEMARVAKSKFDPDIYEHFLSISHEFDRIYIENSATEAAPHECLADT
jgi:HD-GYP domain-containing protein (c-di-GMP phosphodiesterase class II)